MTLTLTKNEKNNARKWVHATSLRLSSRKSGEHRIQAHSHYSLRKLSDIVHKASCHSTQGIIKGRDWIIFKRWCFWKKYFVQKL